MSRTKNLRTKAVIAGKEYFMSSSDEAQAINALAAGAGGGGGGEAEAPITIDCIVEPTSYQNTTGTVYVYTGGASVDGVPYVVATTQTIPGYVGEQYWPKTQLIAGLSPETPAPGEPITLTVRGPLSKITVFDAGAFEEGYVFGQALVTDRHLAYRCSAEGGTDTRVIGYIISDDTENGFGYYNVYVDFSLQYNGARSWVNHTPIATAIALDSYCFDAVEIGDLVVASTTQFGGFVCVNKYDPVGSGHVPSDILGMASSATTGAAVMDVTVEGIVEHVYMFDLDGYIAQPGGRLIYTDVTNPHRATFNSASGVVVGKFIRRSTYNTGGGSYDILLKPMWY
jgi:hypothetical protein